MCTKVVTIFQKKIFFYLNKYQLSQSNSSINLCQGASRAMFIPGTRLIYIIHFTARA